VELTEGGVEVQPADSALVDRARAFLRTAGAAGAEALVAHVCQLASPPRTVAEHLAKAILAPYPEFERGVDGTWRLRAPVVPNADGPPQRLRDLPYVVVDVETTGGRAQGSDRITEIAVVRVEHGEIVDVFQTLVNPDRLIPTPVTDLTRITWTMVQKAPRFRDICDRVASALRGGVFVAHNAGFDWRFVAAELARATGQRLTGRRLCTVRLAASVLPQLKRRSLDSISRYYGIENAARHRAGGDAVATAHVLIALLDDAADRGCETWDDLLALITRPPGSRRHRKRRRRSAMPQPSDGEMTA
jgi:DNA polymerase III subunit epsilon